MSNELVSVASLTNLPTTDVKSLAGGTEQRKFLPRVQLYGSSKEVKEGLIPPGRFGTPTGDGEIIDHGKEIDALICGYRMKAVDFRGESVVTSFDESDPVYQEIASVAAGKGLTRCMEGPEYLLYIRGYGFATYFFFNPTGRVTARNLRPFLPINETTAAAEGCEAHGPLTATLTAEFIDRPNLDYTWWAAQPSKCSTPVECDIAELVTETTKFINPKSDDVEVADDDEDR
jgi:hypothetical protein